MKRLFATVIAAGLIGLVGCDTSSTPGGPGASGSDTKKPIIGQTDNTFTLSMPLLPTSIKQGETKSVEIGIKRGKNFDEDVALKFESLPKGVTIDPPAATIKHGDSEAKVNFKAAEDAAIGDHKIRVTGHPTKGTDASSDLSVTVNKK